MVVKSSGRKSVVEDWSSLVRSIYTLLIIIALGYWFFGEDIGLRDTPQPTIAEVEKQYISDLHWQYIKYAFWGLLLAILTAACLWLIVTIAADMRRRWLASNIIKGRLVVDNYKYRDASGAMNQDTAITDLEKIPEHTVRIHRNGTQAVETLGHSDPAIQAEHTARVMRQRERSDQPDRRKAQGFIPRSIKKNTGQPMKLTAAQYGRLLEDEAGVNQHKARLAAAQADLAELNLSSKRQRQLDAKCLAAEPVPAPEWRSVDIRHAFSSGNEKRLVVAQDQNGPGDLLYWNPVAGGNGVHGRIHGETRSGKTQLALGIVAQAIMHGWDVVILDRRKFKNYRQFEEYAQLVDTRNPHVLLKALEEIEQMHEDRDTILGEVGADNIDILPPQERPKRTLVLVDEFKAQMNAAKRDEIGDDCLLLFESLTAEAGATGIHFLFCDQKPTTGHWGDTMRANVSFALMGYMPKGQSRTTTGIDLGDQLSGFRFWFERTGQFVKGWVVDDLWSRNEAAGRFPRLTRPVVDLGDVIKLVEKRQEITQSVSTDADYEELTAGVKAVVDHLVEVGFDSVESIPTKGTSIKLGVSITTVKSAKRYLRGLTSTTNS